MASEHLHCKKVVLRVSIHCEGCKKKVKKVLQSVDGVYRCDIDARSNKATVAVTGDVNADALIKRLRRSGKNAEQWPDEQQRQPSDRQSPEEAKNQAAEPDKPGDTTEKPAPGYADKKAAEPTNAQASLEEPNMTAGEAAKPVDASSESTSADSGAHGCANLGSKEETTVTPEQCKDPKKKRKQQPEERPADAMVVTEASGQGGHTSHFPPPLHQPVYVMSYSVARPSSSAAYYTAAPAPALPPAGPPPPPEQSYWYPPFYYHSEPSPYHGHWSPATSAVSPARDSYADLFSDDNANSCSVM